MELIPNQEICTIADRLKNFGNVDKAEGASDKLFDEETRYHAVLSLSKSTTGSDRKFMKIVLPHAIHQAESTICIICADDMKKPLKELLTSHPELNVVKIIKIGKFKTNYQTFAARRTLAGLYDIFIADTSVFLSLFRTLGKPFFNANKFPFTISMKGANGKLRKTALPANIAEIRSSALFKVPRNATTIDTVIATSMNSTEQIAENLSKFVESAQKLLPLNAQLISSVYLKTDKSPAVPVSITKKKEDN